MRFMRGVLWAVFAMAMVGLAGTFVIESSYDARARKVQVVTIDKAQHNPYGPVTIDQGEPKMLIVDDQAAYLKNKTATGLSMLDADYLKSHGDAVLRLETVQSMTALARIGCLLSALVACVGLTLVKRAFATLAPPEP
jgi:hypothetical protein